MFSAPPHSWITHTERIHCSSCEQRGIAGLGGDGGSEREDEAKPPPPTAMFDRDKRWPAPKSLDQS